MTDILKNIDINSLSLEQTAELLNQLKEEAENSGEKSISLLPDIYHFLENGNITYDALDNIFQILETITIHLNQSEINGMIKNLEKINQDIFMDFIASKGSALCRQNSACTKPILEHLLNNMDEYAYYLGINSEINQMFSLISDKELPEMLAKIDSLEPDVQKQIWVSYGKLYIQRPFLRKIIWKKIQKDSSNPSNCFGLFQNLTDIISAVPDKIPACLDIIRSTISDNNLTPRDLTNAYRILEEIRSIPEFTKMVDDIIMSELQNPHISNYSKNYALKVLDKLPSHAFLGQRIDKTEENPYGFIYADTIDPAKPSLLFLGGNETETDEIANGYLGCIERLVQAHNIQEKVPLYVAIYNFIDYENGITLFDYFSASQKLMQDHHRRVRISQNLNKDTLHPQYVEDLFQKAFLYRICDKNGKRLSVKDACTQMRNLTIVTHCHGAYTFLKLEEKIQQKMKELGYSKQERKQIQHELLCIAHAPNAPLGISNSTMISFVSAEDEVINHYNNFENEIRKMAINNQVLLSYFPDKRGELIVTPSMGEEIIQHNFKDYFHKFEGMNKEGRIFLNLEGNAIVNGIKNSLSGKPLPTVEEIICGGNEDLQKIFLKIKHNGEEMWQKISANATDRLKNTAQTKKRNKPTNNLAYLTLNQQRYSR